jgi:hypothetical protein
VRQLRLAKAVKAMAIGLIATGLALPAAPLAHAEYTIPTQWYVETTGLAGLKAKGFDGTGVKIAIIDGGLDTTVPELRGANIKVVKPCTDPSTPKGISHGTAITSILASPNYGWAPKAEYTFYAGADGIGAQITDPVCKANSAYGDDYLINAALNDGADVISISMTSPPSLRLYSAAIRAAIKGVPVVASVANDGRDKIVKTAAANGTVGVGAVEPDGQPWLKSNWGLPLTVMAPGTGIALREPDSSGNLTKINKAGKGTSYSTPMVTGALALAKQAWPKANGNQLIASLIHTASNNGQYQTKTGWGTLNATKLVNTDPTSESSENPLLNKDPSARPNAEDIANYKDGLTDPTEVNKNDNDYVYRGNDHVMCKLAVRCELGTSPRFNPGNTTTPAAITNLALPIGIGVGAIAAIALAITLIIRTRRRRTATAALANQTPPTPPAGPPNQPGSVPPQYPGVPYPPNNQPGYPPNWPPSQNQPPAP